MKLGGKKHSVPEVVQTSNMDCGPACLKAMLEGFGVPISYGRLREACQTDVDGTSIDTMEEIAVQLGLDAEQVMVPVDHVLIPEAKLLPAILVILLPNGFTHFVVIWKRIKDRVEVMDPGSGRHWTTVDALIEQIYAHRMPVAAEDWAEWAKSKDNTVVLARRLADLGAPSSEFVEEAVRTEGFSAIAALDAATRMVETIVRSGGLERGREATEALRALFAAARSGETEDVPPSFWSVLPIPDDEDGQPQLLLKGAVLVRVAGVRSSDSRSPDEPPLPEDLVRALDETPSQPGRTLWELLTADGLSPLLLVALAVAISAGAVLLEALLFRAFLEVGRNLGLVEDRFAAVALVLVFLSALLVCDVPIAAATLRLGRRLEARLRVAFLEKIPKLGDRYFSSRPRSDMAERSHSIYSLRQLPGAGEDLLHSSFALMFTTIGIFWLDTRSGVVALICAVLSFILPLFFHRALAERDLRARSHAGALTRHYLDALLGLVVIRTHGAEQAISREHESLLAEWARSSRSLLLAVVGVTAAQALFGLAVGAAIVLSYLAFQSELGPVLLLAYWGLSLPVYGEQIAKVVRRYPAYRNLTLRLLEPLGAPEEDVHDASEKSDGAGGVQIQLQDVTVIAAGHLILDRINVSIAPGEHVAVVGRSGAGKSSLVGLLLGFHKPHSGTIQIDGEDLDARVCDQLRSSTAWIDPAVQLWNRSLMDNLLYGCPPNAVDRVSDVIREADLLGVLERLPEGMETRLGESGGLVSGGEGQRVRLGRAMQRRDARLVILDEPFRGLDRDKRNLLLSRVREHWKDATLICITHDIRQTKDFGRVIVVDRANVVEDGPPASLLQSEEGVYRQLLSAENEIAEGVWADVAWRKVELLNGRAETRS